MVVFAYLNSRTHKNKTGSQAIDSLKNDTSVTKYDLQITTYKKHYLPHYKRNSVL
jgi:hypothetical protein